MCAKRCRRQKGDRVEEDESGGGRGGRLVPETVNEEGAELYRERE